MKETEPVIHSDPAIMGGTPVFVGNRVPLATLGGMASALVVVQDGQRLQFTSSWKHSAEVQDLVVLPFES